MQIIKNNRNINYLCIDDGLVIWGFTLTNWIWIKIYVAYQYKDKDITWYVYKEK